MKGVLIDENLPASLILPTNISVEHVLNFGENLTDSEIWEYAKKNDFIIVTKDADFSNRIAVTSPPPRIVHIRIGNMKLRDLLSFVNNIWPQIELHLSLAKLIIVYSDRIQVVK